MSTKRLRRTPEEKSQNELRQESIKTLEDAYAEPPAYSSRPSSGQTSSSNVTAGETPTRTVPSSEDLDFKPNPLEIPTATECIAHLKLLHAFAKLRHDIGNREGLYGINMEKADDPKPNDDMEIQQIGGRHDENPSKATATEHAFAVTGSADAAGLAERIRDKRWTVFVHKAVDRFQRWWDSLSILYPVPHYPFASAMYSEGITTRNFDYTDTVGLLKSVSQFPLQGNGLETSTNFALPPLDVLMVWHAYMLNPRTYLEDCIRHTKHELWRTWFSWQLVYEAIDNETFEFTQEDTRNFRNNTQCYWNSLEDDYLKEIKCPQCSTEVKVPWTRPPEKSSVDALESYLINDTGFAGTGFKEDCPKCSFTITHEKLRVGKFIDDVDAMRTFSRPLPGTVLSTWGEPECTGAKKSVGTHDLFFPNRVVQGSWEFHPSTLRLQAKTLTMDGLKNKFQDFMKSKDKVMSVNSGQYKPDLIAKNSRIAVRAMFSHYWDNSSIFGIDLVGAVLRQGTFVQKMHKLDWLHSPSIMSTAQRLIVKYHRFVRLAADAPKKTVVPALDVDLAWHTHQLCPKVYYRYTLAETKKFLNHDDKIPEGDLHSAFQYTSSAYEKKYGQPYSECSCWYCECTREPIRSNFLNKFSSRRSSLSLPALAEKNFPSNPHTGPHLSAHNAFPTDPSDKKSAMERRKELEELDLQYARVCKRYQRQKKKEEDAKAPSRDNNIYLYGAYGYPMYYPMPMYVPYYADPGATPPDVHSGDKSGGGCVAATCSASNSLGGCAGGEGTPGCKASCGGHGSANGGCGTCSSGGDGGGGDGGCGGCGGG